MAESYLQHAEHYFRIIAAAQLAQQQAQVGYLRAPGEVDADEGDEDDDIIPDRFASPVDRFPPPAFPNQQPGQQPQPSFNPAPGNQPQPFVDRSAFGQDRQPVQPVQPVQQSQPRQDRNGYQDRQDRGPRFPQNRQQGRDGGRDRDQRPPPRDYVMQQPREPRVEPPRPAEFEEQPSLPAFITGPVRLPPEPAPIVSEAPHVAAAAEQEEGSFHLRPRRRRRPRPDSAAGDQEGQATEAPATSGDLSFGK